MKPGSNGGGFTGPYRGLEPFDEDAAAFFFGRDRENRLVEASLFAAPLSLLYGASGVGKSSVLRAGVLPRLRQKTDVLPVVFPKFSGDGKGGSRLELGWQSDPVSGIKGTAAEALFASASGDSARLRKYRDAVLKHDMSPLDQFFDALSEIAERRVMVILDQFEEYSLYHPEDELFAEQFPKVIARGSRSVSFLLSLREDAIAKLDRFKNRIPTLWHSYRRIDHLSQSAAEDAIRLPLQEYNRRQGDSAPPMEVERQLIDTVLREVQTESVQFEGTGTGGVESSGTNGGRIETPYLQLVMTRLWEREQDEGSHVLRLSTLISEGGAAEIVRTHLDRVMSQFSPAEQDIAAKIFHRLVTPSGTKIAFSVRDLAEYEAVDETQLAPILQRLEEGSRRILRRVALHTDVADNPRYEIFHDRLGKAILSWRTKRLKELAQEKTQREEAERKRMAESERAAFRDTVKKAMMNLGPEENATWARMMLFLVSTAGTRLTQTAAGLASLSEQPIPTVEKVLNYLLDQRILRVSYSEKSQEQFYEVSHDALAAALLEWHSEYASSQSRTSVGDTKTALRVTGETEPPAAAADAETSFPFEMVRSLLRRRRVIPLLGAGAAVSVGTADEAVPRLPSNFELKKTIAQECEFPASEFEASDIAEVASYYAYVAGREPLDALLERVLGGDDYKPSETHYLLANEARDTRLTIFTTNFDMLMEKALDHLEVPYDLVAYFPGEAIRYGGVLFRPHQGPAVTEISGTDVIKKLNHDRTVIIRLNGRALMDNGAFSSYVITEEDQIDWLLGLQEQEGIGIILKWFLSNAHVLSLGQSARDWSQRALLRVLGASNRRRKMQGWAVALRPSPLSIMTWQRYEVNVFDLDLNDWAKRMRTP